MVGRGWLVKEVGSLSDDGCTMSDDAAEWLRVVPVQQRAFAAQRAIRQDPLLDADERAELLHVALWPGFPPGRIDRPEQSRTAPRAATTT
jgi:hypothetical protein